MIFTRNFYIWLINFLNFIFIYKLCFFNFFKYMKFYFFFTFTYFIFIISIMIYLIPIISTQLKFSISKNKTFFTIINSHDMFSIIVTPVYLILLINCLWVGPSLTSWFGHVVFTNFQSKLLLLLVLSFILVLWVFTQKCLLYIQRNLRFFNNNF